MRVYAYDTELMEAGADPFRLATHGFWFAKTPTGAYDTSHVNEAVMARHIRAFGAETYPLLINIEAYDLKTDFAHGVQELRRAAEAWKAASQRPLGYYSIFPQRAYWEPVRRQRALDNWNPTEYRVNMQAYEAWLELSKRTSDALLPLCDFICPSVYPLLRDQREWRVFAQENLEAAKGINCSGVPVRPILNPVLPANEPVPLTYWTMILEFMKASEVDSVMIYSGSVQYADPQWREPVKALLESS